MVELDVDGALFDSAAVWSAFWFVDAETHGRAIERADVRHATVGLFGCIRGGVWNAVERLDVLRQPDISWRCRDLDLAVGLHTMVEVNETGDVAAFTARLHLASIAELPAQIVIVAATETDAIKE
ncbi:hypothetical protein PInf_004284 [Phytophthora infestans]|nr:hypothetical protein PInf_004284 [Phytophthora infestans]